MIQQRPIPTLTKEDINAFRRRMQDVMAEHITNEEKVRIKQNKAKMTHNYHCIIKANGGKNPILGF